MDEMKLKLSTKIMRRFVAGVLTKLISNKLGVKPEINLNTIELETVGDKIVFHIDADGSVKQNELLKLTRVLNTD